MCPVCGWFAREGPRHGSSRELSCEFCGRYKITGTAEATLQRLYAENPYGMSALAHWLHATRRLGMGIAHHKPDSFGLERVAHVLFHVIEDLLQGLFEIGLDTFNVRTITDKFLRHCCPSFQANDECRRSVSTLIGNERTLVPVA